VATERPSSAAPQQKYYTSARQKPYEPPVRQLAPTIPTRPAIKWPKKPTDYVTEKSRVEILTPPPPRPLQPIPGYTDLQWVEEYTQKTTIIESQSPKAYELSPDIWQKHEK